jgi:hypothetical protein
MMSMLSYESNEGRTTSQHLYPQASQASSGCLSVAHVKPIDFEFGWSYRPLREESPLCHFVCMVWHTNPLP